MGQVYGNQKQRSKAKSLPGEAFYGEHKNPETRLNKAFSLILQPVAI
jgi:hypothetical protein